MHVIILFQFMCPHNPPSKTSLSSLMTCASEGETIIPPIPQLITHNKQMTNPMIQSIPDGQNQVPP